MLVILLAISPLSVLAEGENENTINYVALGDSLAAGVLSDGSVGSGYVGMIEGDLETNGYEVNVHNKGVPGAKTGDVLAGLPGIPELADADVITISAGANDILAVLQPVLQPILESGINPADLTPDKIAELQQAAQVAAQAAETAKNGASNAISGLSINESQTAVISVISAADNALLEVPTIFQFLTDDQKAMLNSVPVFIQNAQAGVINAGANIDTAKATVLDTDTEGVLANLDAAVGQLGVVVGKLTPIVGLIESIESIESIDTSTIPMTINVKTKVKEAIESVNTVKSKIESTKLAINVYTEAKATAEAAQLAMEKAAQLSEKLNQMLAEIPGTIQGIGENTGQILGAIRTVNPTAKIYVMGYYNALPYLPEDVQETMTKPMLASLNAAINAPTAQFGATFVPVADLFEGNHQTYLPNPANIHPSEAGYRALANAFMAQINVAYPAITEPAPYEREISLGEEVNVNSDDLIRINGTNVTLLLPDNLPEGTTLTVTATSDDALSKAESGDLKLFGDALNFEFIYPEGHEDYEGTFKLVMGYNSDSPDDIAIYHFNEVDGKWEIQQGENNKELRTISLDVSHFSSYGVFAKVEKTDPTDPKDPVTDPDDGSTDETPAPGAKDPSDKSKDDNKKDTNKDTKNDSKKNTSKGKLPQTATNHYNWLLLGTSLLVAGAMMFIISRKKRLATEE